MVKHTLTDCTALNNKKALLSVEDLIEKLNRIHSWWRARFTWECVLRGFFRTILVERVDCCFVPEQAIRAKAPAPEVVVGPRIHFVI